MQAHSEYAGPDWKYLLIIMPEDIIIIYEYINELTAVRFNIQPNLGGQFFIDTVKKVEAQPHVKAEIFICTAPYLPVLRPIYIYIPQSPRVMLPIPLL